MVTSRPLPAAVLLDLDGTLIDSAPTITSSIAATLERFGRPALSPAELLRFVGPPIHAGFRHLAGIPEEQLADAVATYRDVYAGRMLQAPVFPGMGRLLRALRRAEVPLALATSKPQHLAERILEARGLRGELQVVRGATTDESRSAKADIVADALADLRTAGVECAGAVMVGDRHHDVEGAAAHGLPTILVRWGYAARGEERGARAVVADVDELAAELGLTLVGAHAVDGAH